MYTEECTHITLTRSPRNRGARQHGATQAPGAAQSEFDRGSVQIPQCRESQHTVALVGGKTAAREESFKQSCLLVLERESFKLLALVPILVYLLFLTKAGRIKKYLKWKKLPIKSHNLSRGIPKRN